MSQCVCVRVYTHVTHVCVCVCYIMCCRMHIMLFRLKQHTTFPH